MTLLDETNQRILTLLQQNARLTHAQIAREVGLTAPSVAERIRKLEREGIIGRYVALLDREKVGKGFVVFCHVKLIQHTREFVTRFEKQVRNLTEVLECYHVSGDYDYILKVVVADMNAYREFLITKLTTLEHIGSTHSTFMMGEVKHSAVLELE